MYVRGIRRSWFSIVVLTSLCAGSAYAISPINKSRFTGVAIKGYDPVAYFTEARPLKGDKAFEYEWGGATWRFASEANRAKFAEEPEKFAPQYGGYCAYAVSEGSTAGIDPEAWTIYEGKLYLNYNRKIQATWSEDIPGRIKKADTHWPHLLDE